MPCPAKKKVEGWKNKSMPRQTECVYSWVFDLGFSTGQQSMNQKSCRDDKSSLKLDSFLIDIDTLGVGLCPAESAAGGSRISGFCRHFPIANRKSSFVNFPASARFPAHTRRMAEKSEAKVGSARCADRTSQRDVPTKPDDGRPQGLCVSLCLCGKILRRSRHPRRLWGHAEMAQ